MLINITVTSIVEKSWGGRERVPSKELKRHSLPLFIKLSDKSAISKAHIGTTQHLRWSPF